MRDRTGEGIIADNVAAVKTRLNRRSARVLMSGSKKSKNS